VKGKNRTTSRLRANRCTSSTYQIHNIYVILLSSCLDNYVDAALNEQVRFGGLVVNNYRLCIICGVETPMPINTRERMYVVAVVNRCGSGQCTIHGAIEAN